jgi:ParB family transcriptional regulator, chromosome partitioning protein
VLTAGHARAILSVGDETGMRKLADKIINEDLSVRAAEAAAGLLAPPKAKSAKPVAGKRQDHLGELGERLGDRLDTRVKIALGSAKGTITIDFASVADLRRIFDVLGVDSSVD